VVFRVDLLGGDGLRARLAFSVEDTGIGLGAEVAAALAQPFARGGNAAQHEGTGLGLAIVTQLLDHMDSHLVAEPVASGGSRFGFEVALPLASEDELEPELDAGGDIGDVDGEGRVVLILEPHAARRAVLCDLLDGYGFRSLAASDATSALKTLRDDMPDVVVTEQRLPDMEGWRWLQALRHAHPRMPVLLYSALPPRRPDDAAVEDYDDVLLKPATAAEFMARIVRLLEPATDEAVVVAPDGMR
jgi:CheY-like chemotaxis protein